MNVKRIFGSVLTVLGIGSLLYCAFSFVGSSANNQDVRSLIIFGIIGLIFFISGIGLIRATKDQA